MNIKSDQNKIFLLCTKSKYGNFKQGKIYEATAYAKQGSKYTNFKIEDEDGDLFTITDKYFEKGPLLFRIVEKEQVKDIEEGMER